ncbi:MAG: pyruvate kinase [Deltaproteobacteria bacterium]|nr:pyruvate kinase [Deltaproteobacteria bacterium]
MNRTRIVCTIGPASSGKAAAKRLLRAGMNVARLNFSHGTYDQHRARYDDLRAASREAGKPLAILQDLQGPKIRVGLVEGAGVPIAAGETLVIAHSHEKSHKGFLTTEYEWFEKDVRPGEDILIDDGQIRLRAVSKTVRGVSCKVVHGGLVKEHKGINLPGTKVSAPSLTVKDRQDLEFGLSLGVEYVALSFVRSPSDITSLRKIIERHGSAAKIVAKIEKPEALGCIDAIADATDAVMVARGDLGVEMPVETVPVEQKRLIALCNLKRKPVIVATQMLESMIHSPIPTRAEATDVANAVYDGADAVMLSAESASGDHPFEAVNTMARIVGAAEQSHELDRPVSPAAAFRSNLPERLPTTEAIADAVCRAAADVGARLIVVFTQSGGTAALISKYRPRIPIVAFTPDEGVYNQMALLWGVNPELMPFRSHTDELIESAANWLLTAGRAKRGAVIAITAGMPIAGRGKTNFLKLHKL